MLLSEEEWEQVKNWLSSYRVCCDKEEKNAKHPKIAQYYKEVNSEVRNFLFLKENG